MHLNVVNFSSVCCTFFTVVVMIISSYYCCLVKMFFVYIQEYRKAHSRRLLDLFDNDVLACHLHASCCLNSYYLVSLRY